MPNVKILRISYSLIAILLLIGVGIIFHLLCTVAGCNGLIEFVILFSVVYIGWPVVAEKILYTEIGVESKHERI